MAKFTKFSVVSGSLVYSKTGAAAPKSYVVRGNTVYNNGRKIGVAGTKNIKKSIKQKVEKRLARLVKEVKPPTANVKKPSVKYSDVKIVGKEQHLINYEKAMLSAYQDGLIDKNTLQSNITKYKNGSEGVHSTLWKDVNNMYLDSYGFSYTPDYEVTDGEDIDVE